MIISATQMSKAASLERLGLYGGDAASLRSFDAGFFDAPTSVTRIEPAVRLRGTVDSQVTSGGIAIAFPRGG